MKENTSSGDCGSPLRAFKFSAMYNIEVPPKKY